MAITFPDEADAWASEYQRILNESEAYTEAGEDWGVEFDGTFVFEIRPDDVYTGDPVYMFLDLYDGECREATVLDDPEETEYGFALRADFTAWKDLIEGRLNPIEAILSGPFDLEGDRVKVMQWSSAGVTMADLASEVDTEFPED